MLLHSFASDNVYAEGQREAIQSGILERLSPDLAAQFHNEYLDSEHLEGSALRTQFANYLSAKYGGSPPDLIVTTDTAAVEFICSEGCTLFPNAPVVFSAAMSLPCEPAAFGRPITGVFEVLDFDRTVELIRRLHPDVRCIAAIVGPYISSAFLADQLESSVTRAAGPLRFERIRGTSLAQLRAETLALGPHAAAVLCGHPLFNDEPPDARRLAYQSISMPVYAMYSVHTGFGAVGGCVASAAEIGNSVAAIAGRVLGGEDAADIPMVHAPPKHVFDERALHRFGIALSALPDASEIRYREPTLWSRYRWHLIVAVLALAVMQSVVIFELIRQRRVKSRIARNLISSEERYRRLLDTCPDGIVVIDGESVVFANRSAAQLAGLGDADGLIGRNVMEFVVESDRALVAARLSQAKSADSPAPVTHFRARRVDGSKLTLWARGVACDHAGRPALQVVLRDDSLEQRLQAELAQVQKMEAVGTLAGGVAHDFNNLLTAVLGYASLALNEASLSPAARRSLTQIRGAAERGARLTRQLVTVARGQAVEARVLNLNVVIRDLREMIQRVLHDAIPLRLELHDALWHTCCDSGQIEQVLINLAANARDAMPHGGELTISTENARLPGSRATSDRGTRAESASDDELVVVHVRDTGAGIPAEIQARVFEPFFTTKPFGQGSGLGLASVHAIMSRHGGRVAFDSPPGGGTTFHLYFPRTREAARSQVTSAGASSPPTGTETILLVEDRAEILEVAQCMLRSLGYSMLTAHDGPAALQRAAEHAGTIDLLFTDVIMPQMSGPQLAQRLLRQFPHLCVLYATGYAAGALPELQVDTEYALLSKPYSTITLAEKIREVLAARDRRVPVANDAIHSSAARA